MWKCGYFFPLLDSLTVESDREHGGGIDRQVVHEKPQAKSKLEVLPKWSVSQTTRLLWPS